VAEVSSNIAILLLAAGSSSRLGRSKQMLSIHGEPLLLRSVKAAIASGIERILVVLGANERTHREVIEKLPIEIIVNQTWESGMGNSLKAGLSYLLKTYPEMEGVIIMVCDQPLVTEQHLKKLAQEFQFGKNQIVASSYSGLAGVPALFAKSFFGKMLAMGDEHGAKKIINQQADLVGTIDFPEGCIDIDTEEDVRRFLA
jgi:molybdenum cofactor cytidylyltransferase